MVEMDLSPRSEVISWYIWLLKKPFKNIIRKIYGKKMYQIHDFWCSVVLVVSFQEKGVDTNLFFITYFSSFFVILPFCLKITFFNDFGGFRVAIFDVLWGYFLYFWCYYLEYIWYILMYRYVHLTKTKHIIRSIFMNLFHANSRFCFCFSLFRSLFNL